MTSINRVKIKTPPAVEPVTLAELKTHLRITSTAEDTYLESLIKMSRQTLEDYLGRKFITQTLQLFLDDPTYRDLSHGGWWDGVQDGSQSWFHRRVIELPYLPLQEVVDVYYYPEDDTQTVYDSNNYRVDSVDHDLEGRVVLKDGSVWPTNLRNMNSLEVEYIVGYGDLADDVPPAIRRGILALAAYLYENRGDCSKEANAIANCGVAVTIDQYRVVTI